MFINSNFHQTVEFFEHFLELTKIFNTFKSCIAKNGELSKFQQFVTVENLLSTKVDEFLAESSTALKIF